MKYASIKIRRKGTAFQQYELEDHFRYAEELAVSDSRDDDETKIIKTAQIARLVHYHFGPKTIEALINPHIIQVSAGRFTPRGFEREEMGGMSVEYSQPSLCEVASDETVT